jgi:hypothetical protein
MDFQGSQPSAGTDSRLIFLSGSLDADRRQWRAFTLSGVQAWRRRRIAFALGPVVAESRVKTGVVPAKMFQREPRLQETGRLNSGENEANLMMKTEEKQMKISYI